MPARLHPGSFYALPQSPQLFKQLLMMAGFERYYQIARCFRDEDQRADRQLSSRSSTSRWRSSSADELLDLVEGLSARSGARSWASSWQPPFPRMTWDEAMLRFGSDKPDLRYGLEIADVTDAVRGTEFGVFAGAIAAGGVVRALARRRERSFSRKDLDALAEFAKEWGGKGLA